MKSQGNDTNEIKKICNKCKDNKTLDKFVKNKISKDGLNYICKDCRKNIYLDDRPKAAEQAKKNYIKNKDQIIRYCKEYRNQNKDILLKKRLKYNKERYHNDPGYKLITVLRCRLYDGLRKITKGEVSKNHSSVILLGCSIEFYKQYIQSMFLPEMDWSNFGKIWEIDHIKALANFNLQIEEEQFKAFNYKNTKPIFKTSEIAESFGYIGYIGNREKGKKL